MRMFVWDPNVYSQIKIKICKIPRLKPILSSDIARNHPLDKSSNYCYSYVVSQYHVKLKAHHDFSHK